MKHHHRSPHHQQRSWAEICCFGWSCIQLFWARVVMRKWLNMGSYESDYSADPVDDDDDSESGSDNEEWGRRSRFANEDEASSESTEFLPKLRRQKSSTYRSQYINKKELRVCVGTWNVGGKLPPDDLDIDDWLGVNEPADIYVLGLQEIVPLNPGNIFGAEDTRPVPKWENIIRETLNRVRPEMPKIKSFSDPPSPSKFKPSDDIPDIEEEILLESDSDIGEEVHPLDEENNICDGTFMGETVNTNLLASDAADIANSGLPVKTDLQRQFSFPKMFDKQHSFSENMVTPFAHQATKLTRMLSGSERMGLSWPEPPLHLLSQRVLDRPTSFKSLKSFKSSKSFKTFNSFKSIMDEMPGIVGLPEIDLEALIKRKRRSPYVRIVSKQMVGIFITVWVRRSLRKQIQNLKVSTVGVGVMGYIGNKLIRELKNGVFGGWSEGVLNFPPTYKYEVNSDKYYGEDPKVGKRSPAWCDRILSYGKGMRLLSYKRAELKLSDHRPVTATYMVEVEIFSPRKLQRALTFTDAEIENEQVITNLSNWNLAA
ncbi:Type I inositol-1,4,5-trisphosphate 5-phosphatase 1 [Glycine soja]|nr:Type I inositol-1,4,5-trisphosphate 5-phosphatase 1 [Glycine soja]